MCPREGRKTGEDKAKITEDERNRGKVGQRRHEASLAEASLPEERGPNGDRSRC